MSASEVEIFRDERDELLASCLWSQECDSDQLQENRSNEERYHLTGHLSQTDRRVLCFHAVTTDSIQQNYAIDSLPCC